MTKNKARFHFEQGLNFFHKEDYSQAAVYFEESIVEDPEYSEALYNLSCCCSMLGERDKALIYLSRATKLNPHCQDWAKEDREFTGLREDPVFRRILSGQSPEDESTFDSSGGDASSPLSDEEFQDVKFEKIPASDLETELSGESMPEDEFAPSEDPPPNLNDGKKSKIVSATSDYPPCTRCEGLVDLEKRSIFDPKLSLFVIYVGIATTCGFFFSIYALVGIPVTAFGLYLFSRTEEIWVCQNCGAKGVDCGQPEKKSDKDDKNDKNGKVILSKKK